MRPCPEGRELHLTEHLHDVVNVTLDYCAYKGAPSKNVARKITVPETSWSHAAPFKTHENRLASRYIEEDIMLKEAIVIRNADSGLPKTVEAKRFAIKIENAVNASPVVASNVNPVTINLRISPSLLVAR